MNIVTFSTSKTTTFSTIDLSEAEVTNALQLYPDLGQATRAGFFSPVIANSDDVVAIEMKTDGSAVIVVVATRTTVSDTGNSSS